ncbi:MULTISPECIES: lysophospholipid acyltransferase family protein [Spongiibacter]|uniref:lysophospholipid acyltransferase family protein n=1 Tax=Spongiibacter TaxID=630749 RepID=UPI0003B51F1F|nr:MULTISPECIES: lysophospholipid acyltransferase family protein [Spongiibacter]MAY39645.1 glycerol acyltransferase [Spongiibacter sp.]MBO6752148.1 lysophospholipid acyltransferase family protein [Spongiibacter sp.]MBU72276.1 glycerol acyltransferase [Spongiibacter sp.]|tara:strand:- start:2654 stop:3229 length:576 start_codon:yes stop_codon:yes gene_type:complete
MQKNTIFKNSLLTFLLRPLFLFTSRLIGWKVLGQKPEQKKCVLIAAPHTSNWDFPTMMVIAFVLGLDVHWMGKHTLFPKGPLGAIMRWFGGIAIDRRKRHNTVEQMAEEYRRRDELLVVITPEGTRSEVDRWKGGFYHIACAANVPIVLGFVDAKTKTTGLGPTFYPTGDYEADLKEIMAFYENMQGLKKR